MSILLGLLFGYIIISGILSAMALGAYLVFRMVA